MAYLEIHVLSVPVAIVTSQFTNLPLTVRRQINDIVSGASTAGVWEVHRFPPGLSDAVRTSLVTWVTNNQAAITTSAFENPRNSTTESVPSA